jgi:hypothetical protein
MKAISLLKSSLETSEVLFVGLGAVEKIVNSEWSIVNGE